MARKYNYITLDIRLQIEQLYLSNHSICTIAETLGFHHGTLYRELKRGYTGQIDRNGRPEYKATVAQRSIVSRFV